MTALVEELNWLNRIGPVAHHYGARIVDERVLAGQRIAFWTTIVPNAVPLVAPVLASEADVFIGPAHRSSTDPQVADHLRDLGAEVHGSPEMTQTEYDAALACLTAFGPEILISTGGDAIRVCASSTSPPRMCLEGTATGVARLAGTDLPCPVWDWNSLALKDRIEHRYHVADGLWPAFFALTGLSLAMRTVAVLGYGQVGAGIAARARSFGARTLVVEPDPLRRVEAGFAGHDVVMLRHALARAHVVVTATGRDQVIGADDFVACRDGAILCNAGHSALEIDVPTLRTLGGSETLKHGITLHRPNGRDVLLLAEGGVLNLSTPFGPFANDVWDIFNGVILAGLTELPNAAPGLHAYPEKIANDVLNTFLENRST